MTIGIGGWGPRRKPMALVRAILRSDLKDLTLVSWGGADVGLLVRAGKVEQARLCVRLARHGPAGAELPAGAPERHRPRSRGARRGHVPDRPLRGRPASPVPADASRPRLGRPGQQPVDQDGHQPVRRRQDLVAVPALDLDVALVHLNRADQHGNATYLGPDPYFDDLFCMAAKNAFVSVEQIVDTAGLTVDTPVQRLLISRMMVDRRRRDAPRRALHDLHARLRARREVPAGVRRRGRRTTRSGQPSNERFLSGDEAAYQAAVRAFAEEQS